MLNCGRIFDISNGLAVARTRIFGEKRETRSVITSAHINWSWWNFSSVLVVRGRSYGCNYFFRRIECPGSFPYTVCFTYLNDQWKVVKSCHLIFTYIHLVSKLSITPRISRPVEASRGLSVSGSSALDSRITLWGKVSANVCFDNCSSLLYIRNIFTTVIYR